MGRAGPRQWVQFPAAASRLLLRRLFPATRPAGRTRRRLLLPSSGLRFCLWVLLVWWRLLGRLMGRFLLRKARCVAAASEPSPKTILPSLHGGCSRLLCPSVRLPTCPSVRLSTCPTSVRLSICPSVRLPTRPSVRLCAYLSAHLSVCPVRLCICPPDVCSSVHLTIYASAHPMPVLLTCIRLSICISSVHLCLILLVLPCGPVSRIRPGIVCTVLVMRVEHHCLSRRGSTPLACPTVDM